ncbi:hypothetical protein BH18ACI4_BH18ACI4_28180 [soil metagenome]
MRQKQEEAFSISHLTFLIGHFQISLRADTWCVLIRVTSWIAFFGWEMKTIRRVERRRTA